MYFDYLHWQYGQAPRWLLTLLINLQAANWQLFSVSLMLRTLVAHWHRDRVIWKGGGFSKLLLTIAWNLISRGLGLIVRLIVLSGWLLTEILLTSLSVTLFLLFLLWPVLILTGLTLGAWLLTRSL